MTDETAAAEATLTRDMDERIAALSGARAWPWLTPGSVSPEADAAGSVRWVRVDEHGELHPCAPPIQSP